METMIEHYIGSVDYDCYSLARSITADRGYWIPPQTSPESVLMRRVILTGGDTMYLEKVDSPRPGDWVVFDLPGDDWHVGVIVDAFGRFVHVGQMTGRAVCHPLRFPLFGQHIHGFFRPCHPIRLAAAAS